jgi:hypothetical protein
MEIFIIHRFVSVKMAENALVRHSNPETNRHLYVRALFSGPWYARRLVARKNARGLANTITTVQNNMDLDIILQGEEADIKGSGMVYSSLTSEKHPVHGRCAALEMVLTGPDSYLKDCHRAVSSYAQLADYMMKLVSEARLEFDFWNPCKYFETLLSSINSVFSEYTSADVGINSARVEGIHEYKREDFDGNILNLKAGSGIILGEIPRVLDVRHVLMKQIGKKYYNESSLVFS